jgi:tetratricopeptide (TPR) repeat protein
MSNETSLPLQDGTQKSRGPWIYGPWVDLTVGCGAWSAPFLLLAYFVGQGSPRLWPLAFYFLALLFNYPHFMATIYRAYHTRSEFAKYRVFTVHVTLLLVVAGILVHAWYPLLPCLFTLYICWSPWHYTGQNFGLMMMFARRSGVAPTNVERRLLRLAFVASYLLLMLSFHTGPSGDPLVLSLGLPAQFTVPLRAALAVFFGGAVLWSFGSMAKHAPWRSLLPSAILAATQFLWFLLPAIIELASGRDVPQTRYSSGILAVLHSTQYLWITSYYQERESRAAGAATWSFPKYLFTLIAGGIALFIPGPWIVSRAFHVDFAASFLTFMALVNIHHFILDGALWKLRDSRIATLLLNTGERQGEQTAQASGGLFAVARWMAGSSAGARGLRVGAASLLLAWGAFDQLHFFYSSKADDTAALQRAAAWNPDDSSVQTRLARAEVANGKLAEALVPMKHAAEVNPNNTSLQEEYARGLIAAGRNAEAYARYEEILRRNPKLAEDWINIGLLARRLGREEEAVDDWQKAVDANPENPNAQLLLADALGQGGETQAAGRHYRAYLQIVAAHKDQHVGERATVLSALIKVADADAAMRHFSEAFVGYKAALTGAEKSGDTSLESLAFAHLADLQEKQGNATAALDSHQHALRLDEDLHDPQSAAVDWFNYGQFLRRQKQPERLAFACFLQAEKLTGETPSAEGVAIRQAKSEVEASVGSKAAAELRRDFTRPLQEALTLTTGKLTSKP